MNDLMWITEVFLGLLLAVGGAIYYVNRRFAIFGERLATLEADNKNTREDRFEWRKWRDKNSEDHSKLFEQLHKLSVEIHTLVAQLKGADIINGKQKS